jgi:photosystem II stability/assembly factor-like uncharacterized protein
MEQGKNIIDIPLPQNGIQKEIYGIDVSPIGHIMAVGYDASIYISKDSGNSWTFIQNNSWREFQSIAFRDNDTAVVVGGFGFDKGIILKMNTNAETNDALREDRNFEISDIEFVTTQIGYLSGYGTIMKTIDGGHEWTFTTAKNDFFKAMSWKNEQEGIAVGMNGSIIKTTDGGTQWDMIINGNNFLKKKNRLLDIDYNGNGTYLAVGENGCICISKDEGITWNIIESTISNDLRGLAFLNNSIALVVGTHGTIIEIKL